MINDVYNAKILGFAGNIAPIFGIGDDHSDEAGGIKARREDSAFLQRFLV